MVVNHELDIVEDLAVSPVGLFARLRVTAHPLPLKDALGLRVEHKGHGEQALDPFWLAVSGLASGQCRLGGRSPIN